MASDDYFLEIEAHFAFRRATPFILSGKDWALMQRWRDEGIPLPIVIEAIDSVFEKNETSGRRKVISSLSYCRHAVKELWDARRDLYVGGSDTTPEASPETRLEELANRLEEPFASRVRDLARERSVPRIEERLMEIERELIDSLIASQDVDALRREIGNSLSATRSSIRKSERGPRRRICGGWFGRGSICRD